MSKDITTDVSYILNENNKYITKEFIETILNKFGVETVIDNLSIYQKAMIHMSYLNRNDKNCVNGKMKYHHVQIFDMEPISDNIHTMPLQLCSYERLEYLGDAILHAIFADYIFVRYSDADEGFMTKLRIKIENGDALSILSKKIGLQEYLVISRYMEKNGGRDDNKNLLEDIFEAFIGALYIDKGFDVCKKFIVKLIEKEIDFAKLLYQESNFKEKLLQYFHYRKWAEPVYGNLDVSGPENKKMYTMWVKSRKNQQDEGEIVGIGVSTSKRGGEQNAAKQALMYYGLYKEGDNSDPESVEEISDSEEEYVSVDEDISSDV